MRVKEFAHTIIHNHNILASPTSNIKILDDVEKKTVNKVVSLNYGTP